MIVRPVEKGVRLIAQHDHARAAGTMARNWAGEVPKNPDRRAPSQPPRL